jgi:hypothetical protein
MAHRADILAPACAWAESTQPKPRSRSIASRLGNAVRALKPGVRKERCTKEKLCAIDADAMTEVEECLISKPEAFRDDISTQSGGSRGSSRGSICLSLAESFEEVPSLPGSIDEVSVPSKSLSKSELDDLAAVIADRARSKFSGRAYHDVRSAFLAVDIDGDGKLNQMELIAFCRHFDLSSQVAVRFFNLLDRHDTGVVNWASFMAKYAPVFNKKTDFQLNSGASIIYV